MHRTCPSGPVRGFTLLELMITVSVAGVLFGLAVPAFRDLWLDSQRTVAVNAFVHSVFLARSAVLTNHQTISICRSTDGETCSPELADWQLGWIVFVNDDRDEPPIRDRDERILVVQQAWPRGTITSNRRGYSFKPQNRSVVNGTLVFCDRRGSAHARAIIINIAGRPRVAKRDSDNRPLRCPSG